MTFPRPQSVREARPARQKTLLHVQGGGAPADTKKGMTNWHTLPIVRRGLASAAQAGLLTRDRRREKTSPRPSRIAPVAFGAVSPSQRRDRAGFSPASLFAGLRAGTCASSIRLCRCSRFPKAASQPPGRGRSIIPLYRRPVASFGEVVQRRKSRFFREALIKTKIHILPKVSMQNIYRQKSSALP